eukprot:c20905_g1_i1.p1 GENE.c20905_g1_i1~~c20905_g1_i1.p1  ORF type:complete len:468 (+),score=88.78 c20905_g1_i1:37-1440(+)
MRWTWLLVPALAQAQMILQSPDFFNFEVIPAKYGCDPFVLDDYRPSPPLRWLRTPPKAQSYCLVMDDMDNDGYVHWVVKDIPKGVTEIAADASETNMPLGSRELLNSGGYSSYSGPCPTDLRTHRYRFRLFAMPTIHTEIVEPTEPTKMTSADLDVYFKDSLYVAVLVGRFGNDTLPNVTSARSKDPRPVYKLRDVGELAQVDSEFIPDTKRTSFVPIPIEKYRFVKPSEVRPHRAKAPLPVVGAMQTATLTADLESWSCSAAYSRPGLKFLVGSEIERCPLQLRVPEAQCGKRSMPKQFVGAEGISPSLEWRFAPAGTASFIVMVEDASSVQFPGDHGNVHWLVTDIPHVVSLLDSNASATGLPSLSIVLKNSFNQTRYTPPTPGLGDERTYRMRVFAMPHPITTLFLKDGFKADQVMAQIAKQALCVASAELNFDSDTSEVTPALRHKLQVASEEEGGVIPGESV